MIDRLTAAQCSGCVDIFIFPVCNIRSRIMPVCAICTEIVYNCQQLSILPSLPPFDCRLLGYTRLPC